MTTQPTDPFSKIDLMIEADQRAAAYQNSIPTRRVFPHSSALDELSAFDHDLPDHPTPAHAVLSQLDEIGSPATVASTGPHYFGYVIGGVLPAVSAVERMVMTWDQCASTFDNSPIASTLENVATKWLLDILDLPRQSSIGFGTSATACGLTCLATARRVLLARQDWDLETLGLYGAPITHVYVSDLAHITISKILRVLGFGTDHIIAMPTDDQGRVLADQIPNFAPHSIVCLQAGEVNTGGFDPFEPIITAAHAAGAWVHIDGAFGLWARATKTHHHLTHGVEMADSWTTDGHKWLNTPYDSAMAICAHPQELAKTMNADAPYSTGHALTQSNMTLEFSRRARGISIWAALKSLGRSGVCEMVERHCALAQTLATGIDGKNGIRVLNTVHLNQVLCTLHDPTKVEAFIARHQQAGEIWFGKSVWNGQPAFRLSVSNWAMQKADIDHAIAQLISA